MSLAQNILKMYESTQDGIKDKIKANNDKMTALKKEQEDGKDVQAEIDKIEAENKELSNKLKAE